MYPSFPGWRIASSSNPERQPLSASAWQQTQKDDRGAMSCCEVMDVSRFLQLLKASIMLSMHLPLLLKTVETESHVAYRRIRPVRNEATKVVGEDSRCLSVDDGDSRSERRTRKEEDACRD